MKSPPPAGAPAPRRREITGIQYPGPEIGIGFRQARRLRFFLGGGVRAVATRWRRGRRLGRLSCSRRRGAARLAHLLAGWPRLGLAGDPGGGHAAGPAAGEQRPPSRRARTSGRSAAGEDRQHDQGAADDAEYAHEAGQQPEAHRVEADHHPAQAERERGEADRLGPGDPDQLRGHEHRGVADLARRSTVCGPERKFEISVDVPTVNMTVAIAPSRPPASARPIQSRGTPWRGCARRGPGRRA